MKSYLLPVLVSMSIILRCEGEGICKDVTVSNCDLEDGSLIDSLDALDSIMCQDLCHSFSNCHFFRFDKSSNDENCQLFESSYRETCKIVAAPIYRDVNECLTSTDETCDKIITETCDYLGTKIYTTPPGSTLDSNSCDELCIDYERLDCTYWSFDKDEKQCTLYDSMESECSFLSGPELPSIESCIDYTTTSKPDETSTTTTKRTTEPEVTSTTTTKRTTNSNDECTRNSDCLSAACDTNTNRCYELLEPDTWCGPGYITEHSTYDAAVDACNDDPDCTCLDWAPEDEDTNYYTNIGGSHIAEEDDWSASVKT